MIWVEIAWGVGGKIAHVRVLLSTLTFSCTDYQRFAKCFSIFFKCTEKHFWQRKALPTYTWALPAVLFSLGSVPTKWPKVPTFSKKCFSQNTKALPVFL